MDRLNPLSPLDRFYHWIVSTPSLIQQPSSALEVGTEAQIVERIMKPKEDLSTLPQSYDSNPRLGFLYQELCRRLLKFNPHYRIIDEEIQLQQNGRTLGAIDFLLENSRNEIEHWEVALKFYLLYEGTWYGPNSLDQLDKKLYHMITHQLMMSESDSFRALFPRVNQVSKHLLMQGRLYINPFRAEAIPTHCLDYPITRSQINGYWCHHRDAYNIEVPLFGLSKDQWTVGASTQQHQTLAINSLLPDRINHCQDANDHFWFIVPDSWPHNH